MTKKRHPHFPLLEKLTIDLDIDDIILGGKFKNMRTVVKSMGTDDIGQPTVNGKVALTFRIEKTLPKDKQSKKTREQESEEKKPSLKEIFSLSEDDGPENGAFGKWLFAFDQKVEKDEPDTTPEFELKRALSKHYSNDDDGVLGAIYKHTVKPELRRGNYTKVLVPPGGMVYRGMWLNKGSFKRLMEGVKTTDIAPFPVWGKQDYKTSVWNIKQTPGVLKTREGSAFEEMSWTTQEETAKGFASSSGLDARVGGYFVIVAAKTNNAKNNFMLNPNGIKDTYKANTTLRRFDDEDEVISVGPVHYEWFKFKGEWPIVEPKYKDIRDILNPSKKLKEESSTQEAFDRYTLLRKSNMPLWEATARRAKLAIKALKKGKSIEETARLFKILIKSEQGDDINHEKVAVHPTHKDVLEFIDAALVKDVEEREPAKKYYIQIMKQLGAI